MGFGGSLIIEVWVDINYCGRMVLVVMKVPDDDLERGGNNTQNAFSQVRHGGLIFGRIILEIPPEFL